MQVWFFSFLLITVFTKNISGFTSTVKVHPVSSSTTVVSEILNLKNKCAVLYFNFGQNLTKLEW